MADWYTRTKHRTIHEWVVPAAEPWGACWNQVQQAIDQAGESWKAKNPDTAAYVGVPDSEVRVRCEDDKIVVFYEEEVTTHV